MRKSSLEEEWFSHRNAQWSFLGPSSTNYPKHPVHPVALSSVTFNSLSGVPCCPSCWVFSFFRCCWWSQKEPQLVSDCLQDSWVLQHHLPASSEHSTASARCEDFLCHQLVYVTRYWLIIVTKLPLAWCSFYVVAVVQSQSCLTLCNPTDCSTPGSSMLRFSLYEPNKTIFTDGPLIREVWLVQKIKIRLGSSGHGTETGSPIKTLW